jgi:hypothetical protein
MSDFERAKPLLPDEEDTPPQAPAPLAPAPVGSHELPQLVPDAWTPDPPAPLAVTGPAPGLFLTAGVDDAAPVKSDGQADGAAQGGEQPSDHEGALSHAFHRVVARLSSAFGAADRGANAASHGVERVEGAMRTGMQAAEDKVDSGAHAVADRASDVPVLGDAARGAADGVSLLAQGVGGVAEGATDMIGGLGNAIARPINAAASIEALAEHAAIPGFSNVLRAGHDLADGRSLSDTVHRALISDQSTRDDDSRFWQQTWNAAKEPYAKSIEEKRPGEAAGRGVFDLATGLVGAGEAGDAVRAAEFTSDAKQVVEELPAVDKGLAEQGERPARGTRTETREGYYARDSRERAIETVRKSDQPLEQPDPRQAQVGHGHARHGFETTEEQQAERVRSGRYPDDPYGPIPWRRPIGRASRFGSPEQEAEALGRGRRALDADIANGAIVEKFPDPSTGQPTYVDPVTREPARQPVTVGTNRPEGYGTSQVVRRQPAPNDALNLDQNGNRVALPSSTLLREANVVYEYVPSTGEWRTVTAHPEPADLPNGQKPLR